MSLGVGVIGAGLMGSSHVRTLAERVADARVVAVSDADATRAVAAAGVAEGCRALADPLALIADRDVEAVVVASPDASHEGFVLACLDAGKPVLCEKPLAVTAEASLRVVEAEAALGRKLVHVGFMRRYDAAYRELKARLDGGEVGEVVLAHCVHRNASVPATYTSEMVVTSSLVHEIDVTRWLLGEEIRAATIHASRTANGLRDPQLAVLETRSGVLVDVEVFVNARRGYEIGCELVGESGRLALANDAVAADFRERFGAAYRDELQAWVDALHGGPAFGPDAWDGYAANVVADACLESLAGGRRAEVRLAHRPALRA